MRQDLGNRASPVNRAHMKRPLKTKLYDNNDCHDGIQRALGWLDYFGVSEGRGALKRSCRPW